MSPRLAFTRNGRITSNTSGNPYFCAFDAVVPAVNMAKEVSGGELKFVMGNQIFPSGVISRTTVSITNFIRSSVCLSL